MYQVTVKGRSLEELKDAVNDINNELKSGVTTSGVTRDLSLAHAPVIAPVAETEEGFEDVPSPYTEAAPQQVGAAPVLNPLLNDVPMIDLDSEGIPWDKRIHAGSKAKVKAGTWRTKKGLDPAVLAQVKAELLHAINVAANPVAAPALPITPATPAVAAPVIALPVNPALAVAPVVEAPIANTTPIVPVTAPVVVPAAVAPVAPPVAAPVGGHTLASFKANMAMTIGTLITEGKLTQEYVNQLLAHFKVAQIWEVTDAQTEEMFTTFVAHNIIVQVA